MENSNNTNCCSPNQESNNTTNCCTPTSNISNNNKGVKKKLGLGIIGLALIFAITTAFKGEVIPVTSCTSEVDGTTPSMKDFKWLKTNKKVAYVFLKGNNEPLNKKISIKVNSIITELNETDGSASFLELDVKNENYQDLVSKAKISDIPSVAILGKGATTIINGAFINSAKLIRAYDIAFTVTSCAPNAKSPYNPNTKNSCTTQQKTACSGSKKN